jgi:mRNA interferase RelE/StbE
MEKIPKKDRDKIDHAIQALEKNPRPFNYIKMKGNCGTYRIDVGNYRIIYLIKDKMLLVMIIKVDDRKDVYKKK